MEAPAPKPPSQQQQQQQQESLLDEPLKQFQEGIEIGRVLAEQAVTGLKSWAQKNPEQVLIVGVVAGFVLGKLLFPSRNPRRE